MNTDKIKNMIDGAEADVAAIADEEARWLAARLAQGFPAHLTQAEIDQDRKEGEAFMADCVAHGIFEAKK